MPREQDPNEPAGRGLPQIILGQAQRAGLFSPFGPPDFLFDPIRSDLQRQARASRQGVRTAAGLRGIRDPLLEAFLEMQSRLQSESDLSRALGAARGQFGMDQFEFLRQLMADFSAAANRGAFNPSTRGR
jgi:hypothetical protein